jgi:hypothetical protein
MRYNILSDSFIYNGSPISGTLRTLNALELDKLIASSGSVVTFSGSEVALSIDLGFQRSIGNLEYIFNPIITSGLTIKYGRDLDSLTSGTLLYTASGVTVEATTSGYDYPRYFTINQYTTSSSPITLNSLAVFNTEEEINFGEDGTLESSTLVAGNSFGYSAIKELPIFNNGKNTSDILVGLDLTNIDLNLFNRFELGTTTSGPFSSTYSGFNIPSNIPWEWGILSGVGISDNQLRLDDPNINFRVFNLNTRYALTVLTNSEYGCNPIAISLSGSHYVARMGTDNQIFLIDVIKNSTFRSSYPGGTLTTNQNSQQGIVWDGADRIYYAQNNTNREVKYYKISTNTHHILTTTPYYTRRYRPIAIYNNELYIGGARTTAGTDDSATGAVLFKVNLDSLAVTRLADSSTPDNSNFRVLGNYIYMSRYESFYRYNIGLNSWETLSVGSWWSGSREIFSNTTKNLIYVEQNVGLNYTDIYAFNPISLSWSPSPAFSNIRNGIIDGPCCCANDSLILTLNDVNPEVYVIEEVPPAALGAAVSGSWISPIFKLDQGDGKYYNLLIDYNKDGGSNIKYDNSLSVDNFQIRGSDLNPSCENSIETFSGLDSTVYIVDSLDGKYDAITMSDGQLIFGHDYDSTTPANTPYNSSYLTFGYPFNTTGKMQYKFWWDFPSNKVSGKAIYSIFYIVPFIDTIETGRQPDRNVNDFSRLQDNYISLRVGQSTDSGGTYSNLSLYIGSSTISYSVSATSGKFYEINLIIDWVSGAYSLYFNTQRIGSGTIQQTRLSLLKPQHTYEFLSRGQGIDFQEKIKNLTISRIGTVVDESLVDVAIPVHREDPYYGIAGSLPWFPVTVNSSLIPKYRYMQFKLTLRSSQYYNYPIVENIVFPTIVVCSGVPASGTGSVFMRYNFPSCNNKHTDILKLKAWMKTDKI